MAPNDGPFKSFFYNGVDMFQCTDSMILNQMKSKGFSRSAVYNIFFHQFHVLISEKRTESKRIITFLVMNSRKCCSVVLEDNHTPQRHRCGVYFSEVLFCPALSTLTADWRIYCNVGGPGVVVKTFWQGARCDPWQESEKLCPGVLLLKYCLKACGSVKLIEASSNKWWLETHLTPPLLQGPTID